MRAKLSLSADSWVQLFTLMNRRCSGALGDIDPCVGAMVNQDTLLATVNVNGLGPPAPTSIYRFPKVTKGSSVMVGGGQLNPVEICSHVNNLSETNAGRPHLGHIC